VNGVGIRQYPYSTDMNISPVTYSYIAESSVEHRIGEVWAAMLWDLHWALVEKYGFDPAIKNPESGNFRAIQLVMDGMKIQPCRPGFVDGRNAILMADKVKYNGADTCLISSVFARRGLGFEAKQGSAANYADGIENFDPIPSCIKALKINKVANVTTIDPGQEIQFSLTAVNHKDAAATGVTVEDQLPAGLTFVSASNGGTFSNGAVRWNLGTLQTGQTVTLTYKVKSSPTLGSLRYFRDEMETDNRWISAGDEGIEIFELQNVAAKVGAFAWKGPSSENEKNFWLETDQSFTVTGAKPVLRFWHQFDTKQGTEAGFLEIRKKSEQEWRRFVPEKVIRGAYTGRVPYTSLPIPFLNGFSGKSNGWIQSYFDLSDLKGQDVTIRFRMGSDTSGFVPGGGWYIDAIEAMDMFNYDGEACIGSAAGGDKACARAPQSGVVVNPPGGVDTDEPETLRLHIRVQPNPTDGLLNVLLPQSDLGGPARLTLTGADGRMVYEQQIRSLSGLQLIPVDARAVAAGLYFLRIETEAGTGVEKVMVN
jgi:extracellular elastinolytic metalloproteinase